MDQDAVEVHKKSKELTRPVNSNKKIYVICLPTKQQGVHKNYSLRNVRAFQDRIGIWKC